MAIPLLAAPWIGKLLASVTALWGAGKMGELTALLPELQRAYDEYVEMGGNLGYTGWQWEVLRGNWKDLPEYKGTELTVEAEMTIANVPGLQEAIDVWRETGDKSGITFILEQKTTEEATALGVATRAEVQEIQGLMFIVYFDEQENPLPLQAMDFLGEAPPEGLSPWQEAQITNWANASALQQRQLDWQIEQWGQQLGLSREELDLQKQQFEAQAGLSEEKFAWQKNQFMLELGFEQDQLALSREELEFQQQRWSDQLGLSREELAQQQVQWGEELAFMRESEAARLALEERQIGAALQARPGKWVESAFFETGTPPPTPAWLPKFAPGTQVGQPITQQRVKTPSAQTFGQMPWSQKEMLGGFAEFAAQPGAPRNIQEIQERVGRMLPKERTRQARWQPAFQV